MAKKLKSPEDVLNQLESENQETGKTEEVKQKPQTISTKSVNEGYNSVKTNENGQLIVDYSGAPAMEVESTPNNFGWKNVPFETLPSKGLFYPDDAQLTIRSASVAEIRQWSTIDESDALDMNDKINYILERCCRLVSAEHTGWRDIKELDKFCIIIKIHELTFPNNENNLMIDFECHECGRHNNVPLSSAMLANMTNLDDSIMKYYDRSSKSFFVHSDKIGDIRMFVPSIGVQQFVYKQLKKAREEGKTIDASLYRILPFFVMDWRRVSDQEIIRFNTNMSMWSMNKFQFISAFVDKYTKSIKTDVEYQCDGCGEVLSRPMFFQGGYTVKDIFCISNELDDLI